MDCIKVLLKHGANVALEVADGNTALLAAAHDDKREAAKQLLAHGADPSQPNRDGLTPIKVAESKEHVQILAMLVQVGGSGDSSCCQVNTRSEN